MIEFEQVMKSYFEDIIQDIFCCDCLFETVTELLLLKKISGEYDEFVRILEKKFPIKFLFVSFGGVSVLMCKNSFKFIQAIKKNEPILKVGCITNYITLDGETVVICVVCLIKIIVINGNFLKHFRLIDKHRRNARYLYL